MTTSAEVASFRRQTDEDLIAACLHGEEAAWDVLVTRYAPLVYTIIEDSDLDLSISAAIFHNVWLSFLRQLDEYGSQDSVATWLASITRQEIGKMTDESDPEEETGDSIPANGSSFDEPPSPVSDIAARYDRYEITRQAMHSLDDQSRTLLNLLYRNSNDLTDQEIAERLDIPVEDIAKLRISGFEKLRQKISDFT